jgi:crossover junction endodeoxyribonuclease RusA
VSEITGISIKLPWPPSVNNYWKPSKHSHGNKTRRGLVRTKEADAYKLAVLQTCMLGKIMNKRLSGPLTVHIEAYVPDRRKRDIDNIRKAIYDALTDANVWDDDSQIMRDSAEKIYPPVKGGFVLVHIAPYSQATNKEQ